MWILLKKTSKKNEMKLKAFLKTLIFKLTYKNLAEKS